MNISMRQDSVLPAHGCPRCAHRCEPHLTYIDSNNKPVRIFRCKNCKLRWEEDEDEQS